MKISLADVEPHLEKQKKPPNAKKPSLTCDTFLQDSILKLEILKEAYPELPLGPHSDCPKFLNNRGSHRMYCESCGRELNTAHRYNSQTFRDLYGSIRYRETAYWCVEPRCEFYHLEKFYFPRLKVPYSHFSMRIWVVALDMAINTGFNDLQIMERLQKDYLVPISLNSVRRMLDIFLYKYKQVYDQETAQVVEKKSFIP
jgi:hypothetical protein